MYDIHGIVFDVLLLYLFFLPFASPHPAASCRCMPTDACWPTRDDWASFNSSLGGNLISTTPLASPCHAPNYNADECQYLRSQWTEPELQ